MLWVQMLMKLAAGFCILLKELFIFDYVFKNMLEYYFEKKSNCKFSCIIIDLLINKLNVRSNKKN